MDSFDCFAARHGIKQVLMVVGSLISVPLHGSVSFSPLLGAESSETKQRDGLCQEGSESLINQTRIGSVRATVSQNQSSKESGTYLSVKRSGTWALSSAVKKSVTWQRGSERETNPLREETNPLIIYQ